MFLFIFTSKHKEIILKPEIVIRITSVRMNKKLKIYLNFKNKREREGEFLEIFFLNSTILYTIIE